MNDVEALRREAGAVNTQYNRDYRTTVPASQYLTHVDALLDEVVALRRDVEAAAGGLVQATEDERKVRDQLAKAEGALDDIGNVVRPISAIRRTPTESTVFDLLRKYWREKGKADAGTE